MKNKNNSLLSLALGAMFAAMICALTTFVHIPTNQGYVHVGDSIIFLAACLLPAPYAICASAIGGGLADLLSGYAVWVIPTAIIKAGCAAVFSSRRDKIINKRNLTAIAPAALICIIGYYLAGALLSLLSGSALPAAFAAALADVPSNLLQCAASAALFIPLGIGLDKAGVKKRLRYSA